MTFKTDVDQINIPYYIGYIVELCILLCSIVYNIQKSIHIFLCKFGYLYANLILNKSKINFI